MIYGGELHKKAAESSFKGGIRVRISARLGDAAAERIAGAFRGWSSGGGQAQVLMTGSMGCYDLEPIIIIDKPGAETICFTGAADEAAALIRDGWLSGNDAMPGLALGTLSEKEYQSIKPLSRQPLFRVQRRVATWRCGLVDPWSIGNAIADFEGYAGYINALQMTPDEILEAVNKSGLLERDGRGEPVYAKWKAFSSIEHNDKVIVCTAFDNDIEARAAQMLLEGDPHGVMEGLLIAAYALGVRQVIIAVPAGTGQVRQVLERALVQMKEYGIYGGNGPEAGYQCGIELREKPRALIAAEKTALLNSLCGLQAIPSLPGPEMLCGNPAIVTGIETIANLAALLRLEPMTYNGASLFKDEEQGAKLMTPTGDTCQSCTMEIPFGTPIRDIIHALNGPETVKAIQFGGVTSAFFGADALEKTVTYETASAAGAGLGMSLINVVRDGACAVETTEGLLRFIHEQACGKCVFCREGVLHLLQTHDDIISGRAIYSEFSLMEEIALQMKSGCICDIGKTAANPVLSGLRIFGADYEHHLKHAECFWRGGPSDDAL